MAEMAHKRVSLARSLSPSLFSSRTHSSPLSTNRLLSAANLDLIQADANHQTCGFQHLAWTRSIVQMLAMTPLADLRRPWAGQRKSPKGWLLWKERAKPFDAGWASSFTPSRHAPRPCVSAGRRYRTRHWFAAAPLMPEPGIQVDRRLGGLASQGNCLCIRTPKSHHWTSNIQAFTTTLKRCFGAERWSVVRYYAERA